jgi:DNA-binding LytR/AlgR family response regulator
VKVMVVDDEAPARRRLVRMLEQQDGIEVASEADSALAALAAIEHERPDLLLLDIEMPGLDGLALVARYAHLPPVVFVTGHDEHAIRAFELDAVDYLLKPVRQERLSEAIDRTRRRTRSAVESFRALPEGAASLMTPRVMTLSRGTVRLFDAGAITRFGASHKYTVFIVEGEEHLTEEPLSALADRLRPHGFLRVHRAELVNRSAIRALHSSEGRHEIHLDDGQVVRVSRRQLAGLKKHLDEMRG